MERLNKFVRRQHRKWDLAIFREVNRRNCYRLPTRFRSDDLIIDIGAHIGSFAYACLTRNCGQVLAYEPDPRNYAKLRSNLLSFGTRVQMVNKAVWRSDLTTPTLEMIQYDAHSPMANTGGGNLVTIAAGRSKALVQTISLDNILQQACPVRLLKLDCEGSEYPILFTCTRLSYVEAICAEYHTFNMRSESLAPPWEPNLDSMREFLRERGFRVETAGGPRMGYFWAFRSANHAPPLEMPMEDLRGRP